MICDKLAAGIDANCNMNNCTSGLASLSSDCLQFEQSTNVSNCDVADHKQKGLLTITELYCVCKKTDTLISFYPNVTTLWVFAIAYPSVVYLSVICNVHAPYPGD